MAYYSKLSLLPLMYLQRDDKQIPVPNQHTKTKNIKKYKNILKKMITRFQPNVFRLPLFNPLIPQGNGTGTDQFSFHTPRNT